eukprot:augustus_masked-scaffold_66-processed-gene-0.80-mRNA-1 protein AED:1.00 eAED:1.00 QI:0/-1/0/0/-1/1/1/0/152
MNSCQKQVWTKSLNLGNEEFKTFREQETVDAQLDAARQTIVLEPGTTQYLSKRISLEKALLQNMVIEHLEQHKKPVPHDHEPPTLTSTSKNHEQLERSTVNISSAHSQRQKPLELSPTHLTTPPRIKAGFPLLTSNTPDLLGIPCTPKKSTR